MYSWVSIMVLEKRRSSAATMLASPAEASPATEPNRMAANDFLGNWESRRQYRRNLEVETGQEKERHKLDDVQNKRYNQESR